MRKIIVITTPHIPFYYRYAARLALKYIALGFDTIYLSYPEELDELIPKYIIGALNFNEIMKAIVGKLTDIYHKLFLRIKYFLDALKEAGAYNVAIRGYLTADAVIDHLKGLNKLLLLTARAASIGRIDNTRLIEALKELEYAGNRLMDTIAERLSHKLRPNSMLILDRSLEEIADIACREYMVQRIKISPYIETPIEHLLRAFREHADVDTLERIFIEHVEYISKYILTSGDLDEAYLRWVRDRCLRTGRLEEYKRILKIFNEAWM